MMKMMCKNAVFNFRALKYAELVGRAMIDQYGALDADEIDKMLTALYTVPQKVIFAILKPCQEHSDEIVKSILEFAQKIFLKKK